MRRTPRGSHPRPSAASDQRIVEHLKRRPTGAHRTPDGSQPRRYGCRSDLSAALLLAGLCLLFFWPVFAGRVPLPAEALYFIDPAYTPYRPTGVSGPLNPLMVADNVGQMYVWRQYTSRSLRDGALPLWNPYSACGMPFLANDQSAVLNPANFILNLVASPALARTLFVLFCLLAACLFTYGLVRSLGGPPLGGLLAGLTFGFGGFMFIWLGLPLAATAAWFPALLWVTHSLVRRPILPKALLLALVIGCQFLSGHLSSSVQMLAFWAVFLTYELILHRSPPKPARGRSLLLCLLALILGTGLAAPQLVPLREFVALSPVAAHGRSRWTSDQPGGIARKGILGDAEFISSLAPDELALLLLPEWRGNPAFDDSRPHPTYGNYAERASYVGATALLALVAGLLLWPSRGYARFFLIAAWLVFGVLLHLPVLNLATYVPILKFAAPQRMRFIFSLCAAVALGLTVSQWLLSADRARREDTARARPVWLIALILALVCAVLGVAAIRSLPFPPGELRRSLALLRLAKLFAPAAAFGALSIVLLPHLLRRLGPAGAAALVAVAVADLFLFGARWHPMAARANILPDTPPIQAIRSQARDGRITGPPSPLRANLAVGHRIYDARVYDPLSVSRFVRLVETLHGHQPGTAPWLTKGTDLPAPTLDRLTSVTCRWEWDPAQGLRIQPVESGLPRAYVTTAVRTCTAEAALRRLAAGLDPQEETLIEAEISPTSEEGTYMAPARVLSYTPHRVAAEATAPGPAWLVLTDTYYPGWRASVNGRPTATAIANYAFRAVPVPPGASTVVFSYQPTSYRVGLFIGLLAAALLAALLARHAAAAARA